MSGGPDDALYWRKKAEEWRKKAEEYERKADESEKDLEEFRESSQMLERELESSLEQSEKTVKELRFRNNTLQLENDTLKDKYSVLQKMTEARVAELEDEAEHRRKRETEYVKYVRELEQRNDDLERSKRALCTSVTEFEAKLHSVLERNVILESELSDKEELSMMVQRLKDEARDWKQEVSVRERDNKLDNDRSRSTDSNKIDVDPNSAKNLPPLKSLNGMSQASRVSAMNLVGDLLRRVGVLETKFAAAPACNSSGGDAGRRSPPGGLGSEREIYRKGRLNRGTSTPSIHNLVRS